MEKPWGREVWWALTDRYAGKILEVRAGHALSLQYHRQKLESMYFLTGEGELWLEGETIPIAPGLAVTIRPGARHRVRAYSDLTIVEVSTPHLEDVVRVEDAYGRVDPGGENAGRPGR